jgi:enoyl-CoA hydratase/carnithine racemase
VPDTYEYVLYETVDDGRIARIMLNRPDARNAQNRGMLVELNDAFLRAEADDEVSAGWARCSPPATTWVRRSPRRRC